MEEPARFLLGRLRCLTEAVENLRKGDNPPWPICFVPNELNFEVSEVKESLPILENPEDEAKVVEKLPEGKTARLSCKGQPLFNSRGGWVRVTSPHQGWLLIQPTTKHLKATIKMVPSTNDACNNWLEVVERMCPLRMCPLHIGKQLQPSNPDEEEIVKLSVPPLGWDFEADKELAQFLVKQYKKQKDGSDNEDKGTCYEHISRIDASSHQYEIDESRSSYDFSWESDGEQGTHWLRFHMKPGAIVQTFALKIRGRNSQYNPQEVEIKGGTIGNMNVIATRTFSSSDYTKGKIELFSEPLTTYYEMIEVHIKSCNRNGHDCSFSGLAVTVKKLTSIFVDSENLNRDMLTPEKIARYPKLQPFQPEQLFYRALLLKRIAHLLNIDLTYLLPRTKQKFSSKVDAISLIRQLWPFSPKRDALIELLLSKTASKRPSRPIIHINRFSAREHRSNPSKDPKCANTIFNQIIRGLDKRTKPATYNFRWAAKWTQWWRCKFSQEGIIDEGGGFRDTLADMADELCPSDPDTEVALPLFIRSPNQSQDSSNVYRDTYIPNPSCSFKDKYYFVGQLMGAMFRSQESLVLSLSQVVWKNLVGEPVSWTGDFVSIDSAEVKFINSVETMSREKFDEAFQGVLDFTTVLSNGETVPLYPGGGEEPVTYENRIKYCRLVKEKRLNENKVQIDAIREGLTSVVPSELLSLVTWQELELKVCGSPEITVEALKKSACYGCDEDCKAVKIMWAALERFTHDDRSRFLRFITGRRRLPCIFSIDSSGTSSKLPTSATCSNTLLLPQYTNVAEAVEKLRYAAYNCIAIATDQDDES